MEEIINQIIENRNYYQLNNKVQNIEKHEEVFLPEGEDYIFGEMRR